MMLDFIHRIETAIKAKGVTFNRVEHDCGLGNGTIKRWAEQSPRLDKLVAVANYLDVSLDYLVYGTLHSDSTPNREKHLELDGYKREQGLICDGSPLDEEEADLVAMYRLLPVQVREDFFDQLHCLYQKYAERKKDSIYWTYAADREEGGPVPGDSSHGGTA